MKPCGRNRKRIAALALGELRADEARELRRHFEMCEGCRRAFEELVGIGDELAAAAPGTEVLVSAGFHHRLMRELRKEPAPSLFGFWADQLQSGRLALAFGLVLAGAIVFWVVQERGSAPDRSTASDRAQPASAQVRQPELPAPTIANYRHAAERSLDDLDDLLTQQALHSAPATPLYSAATLAWLNPPNQSGALERAILR